MLALQEIKQKISNKNLTNKEVAAAIVPPMDEGQLSRTLNASSCNIKTYTRIATAVNSLPAKKKIRKTA